MNSKTKILKSAGIISLSTFLLTIILLSIRSSGLLQTFEWAAYDWFFRLRPLEPIDERIVIVGMSESDIRQYKHPIRDRDLAQLLEIIKADRPRVIGLDLVRDLAEPPGTEELDRVFKTTPNLIGVEKVVGDSLKDLIEPPPILKKLRQVASIDVTADRDGVLRRGFVGIKRTTDNVDFNSLGIHAASLYLQQQGIYSSPTPDEKGTQIGKIAFYPLQKNDGGYQNIDAWDFQFLANFRNPTQSFKRVSVAQVLNGKIPPNFFNNKIVMIGMTAVSIKDEFYTPYSHTLNAPPKLMHGVEIQANFASHLLSAVLDGRPIIKTIPDGAEYIFIFFWGLATAVAVWIVRSIKNYLILFLVIFLIVATLIGILFGGSFLAFLQGWWLPFVPSVLLISGTSIVYSILILQRKNQELERLQQQLAFEKTQSAMAKMARYANHELKMPLQFIKFATDSSFERLEEMTQEIEKQSEKLPPESIEQIENILERLKEYWRRTLKTYERMVDIVEELSIKSRQEGLSFTQIDVNRAIDSILKDITATKQHQNENFELSIEAFYDSAIGEKNVVVKDLNKVVSNLISNACDAVIEKIQKGGDFSAKIVVITKAINSQQIELIVADNGEGISPKIADSIYLPFETSKRTRGGIGLGLHLTYEILKNNGGQIRWERKDSMTRFIVAFPVIPTS